MPAPYNDRWERTKRYLVRNFLVNPGFDLSPIPEEERSSSSCSDSSLPELVVEAEPNRHDHSESYYAGLERRMQQYYRQLFLGQPGGDDEDSLEFDVNPSISSTLLKDYSSKNNNKEDNVTEENYIDKDEEMTQICERQFNTTNESSDDDSITSEQQDTDKIDTHIETNAIRHVSNDKSKEKDGENRKLIETRSESASYYSTETHIENDRLDYERLQTIQSNLVEPRDDLVNKRAEALNEVVSKTKSDSEDSTPCHRTSTTVVEIHAPPVRIVTRMVDGGSPVLIPRFVRRSVSGTSAMRNASRSVSRVSKASGQPGGDDEDSLEFDVNPSISSTLLKDYSSKNNNKEDNVTEENYIDKDEEMTQICERQFNTTNESSDDDSITSEQQDTDKIDTHIETNAIRHVSNDKSKEKDGENRKLIETRSESASYYSTETHIENDRLDYERLQTIQSNLVEPRDDLVNKRAEALNEVVSKTKSDSEDSTPCHRTSTTVVEIHAPPVRIVTRMVDGGSPVLIPRFVRRSVSGTSAMRNASRSVSRVSKASGEIEESIGPDDTFEYSRLESKITERSLIRNLSTDWDEDDDNSFEFALRKGEFESKNIRQTDYLSTDIEMESSSDEYIGSVEGLKGPEHVRGNTPDSSSDEDFEPAEEMRGPREIEVRVSWPKAPVDSPSDQDLTPVEEMRRPNEAEIRMSLQRASTEDSHTDEDIEPRDDENSSSLLKVSANTEDSPSDEDIEPQEMRPLKEAKDGASLVKTLMDTQDTSSSEDIESIEEEKGSNGNDMRATLPKTSVDTQNSSPDEEYEAIEEMKGPQETENNSYLVKVSVDPRRRTSDEDFTPVEEMREKEVRVSAFLLRTSVHTQANLSDEEYDPAEQMGGPREAEVRTSLQKASVDTTHISAHESFKPDKMRESREVGVGAASLETSVDTQGKSDEDIELREAEERASLPKVSGDTQDNSPDEEVRRPREAEVCASLPKAVDSQVNPSDEDYEAVEEMRGPRESGVRASLARASVHTEDSPVLAFGTRANAEKLEDVSDSNETHASNEPPTDPQHTFLLPRTDLSALNDFWSVSSIEVDIEESPKEDSCQGKKRKMDSNANEPLAKKPKNMVETGNQCPRTWEDIRMDFFVGTPMVFRLCGCKDHVCS